ncbi:MAG: GIY-YIG nuclease family protein [Lachnospiraceae bacterium]|jgi:putative endonuclease|nr:GIY-YIG nuclease family protein [Lachnospiraceae bacterium]
MAADKTDKWFVYILECADGTLYTGSTNDLEKRVETHNSGNGAKYTKARLPVKLVFHEEFEDKKEAMKREWFIKHKLSRKQKMELIISK